MERGVDAGGGERGRGRGHGGASQQHREAEADEAEHAGGPQADGAAGARAPGAVVEFGLHLRQAGRLARAQPTLDLGRAQPRLVLPALLGPACRLCDLGRGEGAGFLFGAGPGRGGLAGSGLGGVTGGRGGALVVLSLALHVDERADGDETRWFVRGGRHGLESSGYGCRDRAEPSRR
ncbi:hypothetical protein [Nannocystis pusilla]|uniref:hypothetical protein n=1 Tax=Nannocystis pusilla TaxID=889268 RepID=UPI003B826E07